MLLLQPLFIIVDRLASHYSLHTYPFVCVSWFCLIVFCCVNLFCLLCVRRSCVDRP